MKTLYKRILLTTLLVGAAALALATSANAQTTTFDFGQPPTGSPPAGVYFINSATTFTSVFGTGTTGASFTTQGLYQETNTTTKNIANVGTPNSATPALLMDYAQNSSPSARLVFTNFGTVSTPDAPFNGFALSGNPGQGGGFWQYVQTLSTSSTSPNSFTYQVGGVGTQFALNSIGVANLQNGGPGSVTIEGFLNGQSVATQLLSPITAVGGNGLSGTNASVQIFTLAGFGDVDTVEILNSSGTAGVRVNVNDIAISTAAVPEPSTWSMIGVGGVALLGIILRKRRWC